MTPQRASDGGRNSDIIELGTDSRGRLIVGDIGLIPREPYRTSRWKIHKTLVNFYERVTSSGRSCAYLVPMGGEEYYSYCQWRDSQNKDKLCDSRD
jgi:hypothetical protein